MALTFLALAVLLQAPKGGDVAWETFKSSAGFSAAMPGTPTERKETKIGPSGPTENVTVVSKDGDSIYLVVRITNQNPISKALEAEFFQGLRDITAKTAKVLSDKEFTFAGHPGREFALEKGQGADTQLLRVRYILVSPEVTFSLQVVRGKDKPAPSDREVETFFESLKVVNFAAARPAAVGTKLDFKPLAPRNAGFTMLMPGKAAESTTKKTMPNGSFTTHTFECETASGIYAVSVLEYGPEVGNAPAATKTQMLVQMGEAFATLDKGKILAQESGEFQGSPARIVRYTFTVDGVTTPRIAETRLVMVGRRVYVMLAKGPQDRVNPADHEKFFNSFQLTATTAAKSPAPGPVAPPGAMTRRGRTLTARTPAGGPGGPPTRPGRAAPTAARERREERIRWKRFNSAAGGFSVNLPGEPAQSHEEVGLLGAKGVELVTGQHDESRFIVQYQDLTRPALKKGASAILKAARNSDEKVIAGKVVGEKEATLKGAVGGWAYQIESPDSSGPMARVRTYLVGSRLYQVIVAAPKAKFPTDDSERFFRSFRLQTRN